MNKIERFFGWLFLTKAYMASLSDEQVMLRANLKGWRQADYGSENLDRELAAAHERNQDVLRRLDEELQRRREETRKLIDDLTAQIAAHAANVPRTVIITDGYEVVEDVEEINPNPKG